MTHPKPLEPKIHEGKSTWVQNRRSETVTFNVYTCPESGQIIDRRVIKLGVIEVCDMHRQSDIYVPGLIYKSTGKYSTKKQNYGIGGLS